MVKVLPLRPDRRRGATGKTLETVAAFPVQDPVSLKGHVGEDRGQTELRAVLRMDEKVVSADPTQAG